MSVTGAFTVRSLSSIHFDGCRHAAVSRCIVGNIVPLIQESWRFLASVDGVNTHTVRLSLLQKSHMCCRCDRKNKRIILLNKLMNI